MDFTGMMLGYKRSRPLTDEERAHQLMQKERLAVEPSYDLCAIQLNSVFMEVVDRYYAWRGATFSFMGLVLLMPCVFYGAIIDLALSRWNSALHQTDIAALLIFGCMLAPLIAALIWIILKESFTYTHFPIRLNRKNRKVYVFRPGRPNKPILIANWDKVFFALCPCRKGATDVGRFWDIRGHVLSDDGNTVLDTFAFDMFWDETDMDALRSHWEFIRRYMEEPDGAQQAYKLVEVCLPIANRRESFRFGLNRFFINFMGGKWLLYLLFPLWFLFVIGRWIAARTCRIPVWPKDIEDQCHIDSGDPYVKDASMNPADTYQW